ncbi:hypothetical protein [Micromonospora sp. WMMD736]|uniref:hypothetical protein n=1 Tax=Micromonospora sp. WMMD736 TaxID=3404112 RepID=UPI003B93D384
MADDAAAPDGELSKSTPKDTTSRVTEPDSTAVEVTDTSAGPPTEDAADSYVADAATEAGAADAGEPSDQSATSAVTLTMIVGLIGVLALAGLTGWLGFRAWQSHQDEQQRELFLQVGRQGALNLTTIDWENADADVQRILDSATGTFYDDFQRRAEPFVEVVKQAQSKSTGTITEAGLESFSDEDAQVLVAVRVDTANAGAPEQAPRAWRMRLTVEQVGDDEAKVANVEFVP